MYLRISFTNHRKHFNSCKNLLFGFGIFRNTFSFQFLDFFYLCNYQSVSLKFSHNLILFKYFFIEILKFTEVNFVHWEVFLMLNDSYFFTLGRLEQDLGRCSFCFF